ncbi:T9SS type A sorting domain-containing protein [candidate division KSB1 bacterium]|nr:T9SS type A sorting domain-containing protein [candidate division KSB1 bacterium]
MCKQHSCIALLILLVCANVVFAQFALDGDSTDWVNEPILATAIDNLPGLFPAEIGAATSDRVDIKHFRAKIYGNVLYGFIRFQGSPVWPNYAYDEVNSQWGHIVRHRGYYHLLLDLDNSHDTGWNSYFYEGHYTPPGYLSSLGVPDSDPVGAESYVMLELNTGYSAPHPDSGNVRRITYYAEDCHEFDQQLIYGTAYEIFEYQVIDPVMDDTYAWQGHSYNSLTDDDTLRQFWAGHAWGDDFLEFGVELTALQEYWINQGQNYLIEGDLIGVAAFVETPVDDWGYDMSPRGEITVPGISTRPASITFDGDSTDWINQPVLCTALNNDENYLPSEVGAACTDIVDIKHVKAFINRQEDALYFFIRFWGGPVWPNFAEETDWHGVPVCRHRGYYALLLDLDNDPATGWNGHYYEAHYTPLGWYHYAAGLPNTDAVGAEGYIELGLNMNWTPPRGDGSVRYVYYRGKDYREFGSHILEELAWDIFEFNVGDLQFRDMAHFDGCMPETEVLVDSLLHWGGHAWGTDFLEFGVSLDVLRKYFNSLGLDFLQPEDVIGIAAFVETPIDDWGMDMSPRGVLGLEEYQPEIHLSLPEISGVAGTVVNVPVTISDVSGKGILSVNLSVEAPDSVLIPFNTFTAGTIAARWGNPQLMVENGKVTLQLSGSHYLSGSGPLVFIRCRVKPGLAVGSGCGIEITKAAFNSYFTPTSITNGRFTVVEKSDPRRPWLLSIADVPNDQGKQALVIWERSNLDVAAMPAITSYSVFRRVDHFIPGARVAASQAGIRGNDSGRLQTSQPNRIRYVENFDAMLSQVSEIEPGITFAVERRVPGKPVNQSGDTHLWTYIGSTPALQSEKYSIVAPTLFDSTGQDNIVWSAFFVSAHTAEPVIWFASPPDSGYSADNLQPSVPAGLHASLNAGHVELHWRPVSDADFDYFTIYRDADILTRTTDTTYADEAIQLENAYSYQVTATDFSGNESQRSESVTILISDITEKTAQPLQYALEQNYPNPFNPQTTIRFQLRTAGQAELIVYNQLGQKIRTLVAGDKTAGYHQATWDGRDDAGHRAASGICLAKLKAGDFVAVRKMVLLR